MTDRVAEAPNPPAVPEEEEPAPSPWPSVWKMLLAYFVVTQLYGFFMNSGRVMSRDDLMDKEGNQIVSKNKVSLTIVPKNLYKR